MSTGTPIPAQLTCRQRRRDGADIEHSRRAKRRRRPGQRRKGPTANPGTAVRGTKSRIDVGRRSCSCAGTVFHGHAWQRRAEDPRQIGFRRKRHKLQTGRKSFFVATWRSRSRVANATARPGHEEGPRNPALLGVSRHQVSDRCGAAGGVLVHAPKPSSTGMRGRADLPPPSNQFSKEATQTSNRI